MMWDTRYAEDELAYGDQPNDFLRQILDEISGSPGRALCLAEGQGRNAVFLAERGWDVCAMDASEVGLKRAQALAEARGVEIQTEVADLRDFAIEPGVWDLIVSIFAHIPPDLRAEVHGRVVEGLAPGGALALEAYTPKQLEMPGQGGPPVVDLMMTERELRDELEGLDFEIAREIEREVDEGLYHRGRSAVVQLLARRPQR